MRGGEVYMALCKIGSKTRKQGKGILPAVPQLKNALIALALLGIWGMHVGAANDSPRTIVVGDSYVVLPAQYEGWDLCGKAGASFDEIVSLILEYDDWKGGEVHLLWGIAHYINGTDAQVAETEINMLASLLKQKGIRSIVIFRLKDMLAVLEESEEYRRDPIHLNRSGYNELYARKGLSLSGGPAPPPNNVY
jgi:hypothetical protein